MEIIVTHLASDFDSFAGMVAAKKIFPSAEILLPSSLNQNVREFMVLHEDDLPVFKEISDIDLGNIKKVIMIDTRIPGRIGQIQKLITSAETEIITIDHHQRSREDIKTSKNYFKKVGSTTTIIIQEIIKRKIDINQFEATLFLLGIYEDTGNFTYPNTSFADLDAGSFLLKKGANLFVVSKFLNLALSEDQHFLLEKLIFNSWKIRVNGKEILLSKTISDIYVEGLSVLTRKLALVEESDIVFCWVKMKEKVYIVGRSDDIDVDVSKILLPLGGGGHRLAASSVVKYTDFGKVEKILVDSLKKNIKRPVLSKNIMTFPVKLIEENKSIEYASDLLKKYGHSGIPIVNSEGILTGIITRKDIDKAIKHGLSHAPVKGFKSGEIITATPDTTLEEIQRLMIENGIGRIPIVSKNKIIGIITRKDLLRSLNYKEVQDLPEIGILEEKPDYFKVNIKERIGKLFPESIKDVLVAVSNLAKELKYKVYLVGGVVRDILLNKPNFDIDIVIEGDGINFSNKLANKINAKVWTHRKFKTSVIVLENKRHIDVATARIEYYEKPAALPDIEQASIKQDLYRRDFTINSMAVSLNKDNYMTLLDFFGGRKDLTNKKIKVMHKLSFVEDPTRIFRAVRFEQRFAFKIDIATENLIRNAIRMEIISKLTGVRIRDELIAIFEEESPGKPLKRLYELGALEKINIHVKIDTRFENKLIKVLSEYEKIKKFYGECLKRWRLVFCMLLCDFDENEIIRWCSEMKVRNKDTEVILSSVKMKKNTVEKLRGRILNNSELYLTLKNVPAELQVILYSYGSNIMQNISNYVRNLKDVKLSVNGDTLIKLGFRHGSEIGKALEKLILLKLDGKIKNNEDEILQAKNLLTSEFF